MRTLAICHIEPYFEQAMGDLKPLVKKVVRYSKDFDRVINIHSAQALSDGEAYEALTNFRQEEWIWGFDGDEAKIEGTMTEGEDYIPTTGHEYSYIEPWMKELNKKDSYTLVGGCRSECLQDVYEIFLHLGLKVRVKESLTY